MALVPSGDSIYEAMASRLLEESGCTVRRWRRGLTGLADLEDAHWAIECPQPTTARRFAVFAHEVAHQLLHRHGSRPRWREELEAWEWALSQFDRFSIPGKGDAMRDAAHSLVYAAAKADRRGCSPETAQEILDAYPDWVWSAEGGCENQKVTMALESVTMRASV